VAPPGGFVINLQTNVTLSGPLSPIFNSVTINGNGFTISGNNTTRIFMIGVDTATQTSAAVAGSIIAQRPQVTISNVTLSSGLAQGGAGAGRRTTGVPSRSQIRGPAHRVSSVGIASGTSADMAESPR